MGNRRQPFGYKLDFGKIVVKPQEAEMVRSIYLKYLEGASFKELTAALRMQEVPYDNGKLWNINMVARVLEDSRYTGTDRFPQLIAPEEFNAAQERRKKMKPEYRQTPAQKELRKLCGSNPPTYVERQVIAILNHLIMEPMKIEHKTQVAEQMVQTLKQQRHELDALLHAPPVDEAEIRPKVLAYADAVLNSIGPEEFETERLRRLFMNCQPMTELDAELLRQSVRKVTYNRNVVNVLLKNNQWIGGGSE